MPSILLRTVPVLLLAVLTSSCARDNNEQQKELTQLRTEIEQLTNALGRLEFRVFELENQQSVNADDESAGLIEENTAQITAEPAAEKPVPPEQSDKRFDLAPVE